MAEITLSNETVQYINIASKYSNVNIIDCIIEDDWIVFVVEKGHLGAAIGAKAKNLERLRAMFKKNVKFVEFDKDPKVFVVNLCKPYKVNAVNIQESNNQIIALVDIEQKEKSKLIGKAGKNINMIRKLAQRHHPIKDVQVI